jgi:hypothetical protein
MGQQVGLPLFRQFHLRLDAGVPAEFTSVFFPDRRTSQRAPKRIAFEFFQAPRTNKPWRLVIGPQTIGGFMTEQETVKQSADLLRKIIRSIDKKLEYNLVDPTQQGRFSLRLSTRGRAGVVSLLTNDLRLALVDDVARNAIRQKIKSTRDHLLSHYVDDVIGRKMARMLKQATDGKDDAKSSFFYRRPTGRR